MQKYSDYFKTIHDETQPSHLGRGTHLSVLRALIEAGFWHSGIFHDFGVVWDEDHDIRVINVIERMFAHGLLAPVAFIGERKGYLEVWVYPDSEYWTLSLDFQAYCMKVEEIAQRNPGDSWHSDVSFFNPKDPKEDRYLSVMHSMWRLGSRDAFKAMNAEYEEYEIQHDNNLISLLPEWASMEPSIDSF